MGFIYDLLQGTQINNALKPTMEMPLDPRCVVSDYSFFSDSTFLQWLPYTGMIAIATDDYTDSSVNPPIEHPKGAYWYDGTEWHLIGGTSNFEFHWPPRPDPYDPDLNYYLQYFEDPNDGSITPAWTPINTLPSTNFTFKANTPYIETEDGYIISDIIQSSERMELNNQYTFNNVLNTADVISVKDDDNSFHLMLNPDLFYILHGGDSDGQGRVQLTVESPIIVGVSEISGPIGIRWFIGEGSWTTNPDHANMFWYKTHEEAANDFEVPDVDKEHYLTDTINFNDPTSTFYTGYNNLSQVGDTITFYAIATKNGWLDSYIREITIEIVDDEVHVNVAITNITRTTAELNV